VSLVVVCDAGPIIHLNEAGALSLLSHVGRIVIPRVVDFEVSGHIADWNRIRPEWLNVTAISVSNSDLASEWYSSGLLDLGEAEAIALAREAKADWFLTDDTAARLFAHSYGLEIHGSLGLVLWSVAVGHINKTEGLAMLKGLSASSLWISTKVMAEALAALDRLERSLAASRNGAPEP